ncbi:MAG: protein kinase [Candidatus Riflebacteria bacterium]|nr:protein kinase [Candidatus Riflebacteria bacterium]
MSSEISKPGQTPMPGTIINGCKIIAEIGAGGMGSVYKALDESLNRHVAIKIMHQATDNRIGRTRFLREASAIARLDHPGIVKIYSYGEYNDQPYFVMELVEGWSIRDFIAHCSFIHNSGHSVSDLRLSGYLKESLPGTPYFLQDHLTNPVNDPDYPGRVRKLMASAASALASAHQQQVIHRDIKCSNLLINSDSNLKVIDFGLVKQHGDSELTRPNQFMGTLSYAAPEQLMGERAQVTPLTDIYSLGIVMYELACLRHPIRAEDPAAIVTAITRGGFASPRTLNSHISEEFAAIILKCIENDPARRFADAGELAEALQKHYSTPTWFSGFKEILKGWFLRETPGESASQTMTPAASKAFEPAGIDNDSPKTVALKYLDSARKKFFVSFAVIEAIEDLKQAFEIDPGNADTLFLLCFALNTIGERAEIKPLIETSAQLISRSDEKASGKFMLTRSIFLLRDYEEGRKQSIRLRQIYSDDQDFYFALFFCLETLGNYTEAIAVGDELARFSSKNNIVAVALSECYFSIMDFASAIEVLRERIEKYPDFHNLRLKVMQALMLSGKFNEAAEEAALSLRKDPHNMLLQFYNGRILSLIGDYEGAFTAMRQAVGTPGDEGLRAMGYYSLYRLAEILKKPESAGRYLAQAQKLKPEIAFMTNQQLTTHVSCDLLTGIAEEIGDQDWFATVRSYAHKICIDTLDGRSYTIGNYGCTSVLVLQADGNIRHHAIFSNFNLYEGEELYTQLWLPEMASSPFVDQHGNILTSTFYRIDGKTSGGIVSITLAEPWNTGKSSHICCRLSDSKLIESGNHKKFVLPNLPQPACRHQAFLIVLPTSAKASDFSQQPDEIINHTEHQVLCYFQYLTAGAALSLEFSLS